MWTISTFLGILLFLLKVYINESEKAFITYNFTSNAVLKTDSLEKVTPTIHPFIERTTSTMRYSNGSRFIHISKAANVTPPSINVPTTKLYIRQRFKPVKLNLKHLKKGKHLLDIKPNCKDGQFYIRELNTCAEEY
ncbi:hypothetical protein WA026_019125 [Henosepilachna vigintioctopunctata]|uniref:Uncharacterized protein n=1 Tax=Henosepilachna vigintioctopunctata TaxID=420089 RepID=A0AAW1UVK3_9CUCU